MLIFDIIVINPPAGAAAPVSLNVVGVHVFQKFEKELLGQASLVQFGNALNPVEDVFLLFFNMCFQKFL